MIPIQYPEFILVESKEHFPRKYGVLVYKRAFWAQDHSLRYTETVFLREEDTLTGTAKAFILDKIIFPYVYSTLYIFFYVILFTCQFPERHTVIPVSAAQHHASLPTLIIKPCPFGVVPIFLSTHLYPGLKARAFLS